MDLKHWWWPYETTNNQFYSGGEPKMVRGIYLKKKSLLKLNLGVRAHYTSGSQSFVIRGTQNVTKI
jgi:hypothetical protein